ncbi:Nif-specific regulatory protein [delta proteobacterium NaphS2]|nr:Nif-specific regulatory protein [delta proteobacterium NaphS2]
MDKLIRKNNELSAILDVSRVLTSSFDLDKNLMSVMKILSSRLEMQRGCVFLLDSSSGDLHIVAAHGLTLQEIRRGTYRIGEGIVGRVIESESPMFIPNIGDEPKFLNKTASRPQKSGVSFICVPIALDKEILGVISVDRIYAEERGSVDDDLRVLHIVSSFIAQFVTLWKNFRDTKKECGDLRSQLEERYSLPNIVGESPPLQQVLKSVSKVAGTDTTVLLLGESGTGKELIAQTLHYQSHRAKGPFVAVNLAALPENLIEVELFGVEKGAFTGAVSRRIGRFETAHNGTLFLDEIGELPLSLQVKLLRFLQEQTFERIGSSDPIRVDVRVVTATNRNLFDEVRKGKFREDLYWRLNVVPIVLPPLRERVSDVPLLLDFYVKKFNDKYKRRVHITEPAVSCLKHYPWPGNVRELANTVERLVVMAEKDPIFLEDLPANLKSSEKPSATPASVFSADGEGMSEEVERFEKREIINALKNCGFVKQRAARLLGITPRQLTYRMKKYAIDVRRL